MSDSLWPHGLQPARLPCPSLSPGACSNSCPLSQWCHPAISSSVISFSSCLQSFTVSGSFLMIHLFTSGGQSIGVSASALVFLVNIQDWFPSGWTGWFSLPSKGLSRVFSNQSILKEIIPGCSLEGLMLKLKLQYFGHLMRRADSLKRPWRWERLKAGGGDDRGWDGWMASLTQWTRVWVSSGSWWWTGKPRMLQSMGLQRVGHDWATELNWWHACFIWKKHKSVIVS